MDRGRERWKRGGGLTKQTDRWIDGWMDGWMAGSLAGWMDR